MKKYYLIVANEGKNKGLPIPIKVDLFLIGSDPMCQIRSHLPGVGPQHCAIVTRERKVFIRDLDSDFDTLVNGAIMPAGEEWPLHASDRLKVGPLQFLVQFQEKPLSQRDLEEWALKCLDVMSEIELTEGEEHIRRDYVNAAEAAASILDKLQVKRGIVKGRLRIGRDGRITTIRFNDVYLVEEAEVHLAKKELFENAKPGLKVLLDCKNVRRMSSVAAEMIFEFYKKLQTLGSNMAICRVRPELTDILHAYHVLEVVPHFSEKRAALTEPW
jgi:anti-anti-sigma regulatory factor